MLYDHIPCIKWDLNYMAGLHCFPLIWDGKSRRVAFIQKWNKVLLIKIIEIVQMLYLFLICYVGLIQSLTRGQAGCNIFLLYSIQLGLSSVVLYLLGMGVQHANSGGNLLNLLSAFENWLQHTFQGRFRDKVRYASIGLGCSKIF